jgi:hypothetical protein
MSDVLGAFTTRFLGLFIEAVPFLLLGTMASGLIEVFVDRAVVARFIPRNPVAATGVGAVMGFAFPVCECGVVPVTRRLLTKGLPLSAAVAFLLASPVMNPIVLVGTWSAFGLGPVLVGRILITVLVACAVGLVFARGVQPWQVLRPQALPPVAGGSAEAALGGALSVPAAGGRIAMALQLASGEFFDMGRFLVVGSALAAGMQTLVSQDALVSLGRGTLSSVLAMQFLAYVLSVCSTVDAFLALAFKGTFTTASILAFLTFGPMVDIKSTLMFLGVFRARVVLYLILLPMLMIMAVCLWLNLNIAL